MLNCSTEIFFVLTRHKNKSNQKERQRNKGQNKVCQVQHTSAILFWIGVPVKSRRFRQLKPSKIFQRALKKVTSIQITETIKLLLHLFFTCTMKNHSCNNIHRCIYIYITSCKDGKWKLSRNKFLLPHHVVKYIQATFGLAL